MTGKFEERLSIIKEIFPADISSVTVHENGDDFIVFEINHEWMFRFARNEISRSALEVEKAFLVRFKTISPLPVPDHRYCGDGFVGYPKIYGGLLSMDLFQSLSKTSRDKVTQQIGRFLSAVHTFPVNEAESMGLAEGWNGWHEKAVRKFREVIAPQLTPAARTNSLACIERMLAEPFVPKVIHGDFCLEDHVFFDEQRQELSGVIDFADATLNDPAHDFQNIVEYGGEEFFDAVMNHYHGAEDPALLERTKLRIETRPLFDASYSLMFGFEERFKDRMNWIESTYGCP
jgi:aminoglycoside 2''-phosphotransferase